MQRFRSIVAIALAVAFGALAAALEARFAHAAESDSSAPEFASDPVIRRGEAAARSGEWKRAAEIFADALRTNAGNAEYHNRYAYSLRHLPNPDMERVFHHYREALRLAPEHRGAHEYIGEAYLMVGDLARAKEHLSALDRICFFGCEEYDDLKRKVAEHEKRAQR